MISFEFTAGIPVSDRKATLEQYVGLDVTLRLSTTGIARGNLDSVAKRHAVVDGKNIHLSHITDVVVSAGGDWQTNTGHSSGALTERIHVRCTLQEKADAQRAWKQAGAESLGHWVRQLIAQGAKRQRARAKR